MAQSIPSNKPKSTTDNTTTTATTAKSPGAAGPSWGVDANTEGGGVWANTSSKKEKLNELLTDLNATGVDTGVRGMESLDDAATLEEKLDLAFADGLKCVAKFVDSAENDDVNVTTTAAGDDSTSTTTANDTATNEGSMQQVAQKAKHATTQFFQMLTSASTSMEEWEQSKFEATMNEAIRILSTGLPMDPNLKKPVAGSLDVDSPLCYVREFTEASDANVSDESAAAAYDDLANDKELKQQIEKLNEITAQAFSSSIQLYRALLLRATAQTLLENWSTLTEVTSGDIDRAAVAKESIKPQRSTVSAKCIQKLFESYTSGNSQAWTESWWNLIDADNDGRIDEEEMNSVVDLAIKPVHLALKEMVDLSLEVCPVRTFGLGKDEDAWFLGGETIPELATTYVGHGSSSSKSVIPIKLSWRNRRAELKARKILAKTFAATLVRHFRDQVETPHRLRCIYAWADKSHQDNKIDSILVDASEDWGAASSIVGRKRYVELQPKISYAEFREVQAKHFPHLDKIGEEILMSFKEDLWVLQGKGRQNKELRRDCALFLLGVSLVDLGIGLL